MTQTTPSRRATAGPLSWLAALAGTVARIAAALLAAVLMLGALLFGAFVAFAVLAWALLRGRRLPRFRRAGRPPAPGEVIDVEVREVRDVREESSAPPQRPRA